MYVIPSLDFVDDKLVSRIKNYGKRIVDFRENVETFKAQISDILVFRARMA